MLWKFYFWIMALIFAVTNGAVFLHGFIAPYYAADIVVSGISLTGLFLYAYKKIWGKPVFWRAWLFVCILWDCVNNFFLVNIIEGQQTPEFRIAAGLLGILFSIPVWIAVYLYGYKFLKTAAAPKKPS